MTSSDVARPNAPNVLGYDPFAGGELTRVAPTTEPQREVWLADRLGQDASLAYNESGSLRMRGLLDVAALRTALQVMVDRHDALRANFGPDGETLCVRAPGKLAFDIIDASTLDAVARTAMLDERARAAVETPFDLKHGNLFRAELIRFAADDHVLLMTAHHIVCDGWSWWVLLRELGGLYALVRGETIAVLPEPASFADYALSQAGHRTGAAHAGDEAYWLTRFSDGAPVLELPTDHARPIRRGFASAREDVFFDVALTTSIRRLGARRGASLFATLLAGFAALVGRISGQEDVVVGIPAAGQSVDDNDSLVGHCVNLLPLRYGVDAAQPFASFLDAAQTTLLDALDHQRYTFGTLLKKLNVARDPARLPLVSVLFNIDQAMEMEQSAFPGLAVEFSGNARSYENFEIFLNAVQTHGGIRLECQYNTALFDAETILRWLDGYRSLLQAAIDHPEARLGDLPVVTRGQREQLQALQPLASAYDASLGMHGQFEAQAIRTPTRIALCSGDETWTYAQLDANANRIARLLRAQGVHRGSLVGLALERGPMMLAALLGVLKSGAGYVPLDPAFPAERLAFMVGDAGLAALLTSTELAPRFDLRGRPVLALDALARELKALPGERLPADENQAQPNSVAYVIYTSGSTGQPKGVQVPHGAVANFLATMQVEPGIVAEDVLVAVTTLSFDIAVLELLLPLGVGAQVVLADRETALDGIALAKLLSKHQATMMQATPSTWRLLIESGWQGGKAFSVLCGGEPLPPDLAQALLSRSGAVWNLYGPTETTVWSTCWRVKPGQGVSIGRPIGNTQVWILDAQGQLCPLGVPGEICIGGDGVTLGYLGRPELTAKQFVADAYSDQAGAMIYRTGDRGRWRSDGLLEHLGRMDFQVKVRGYRIELGEIEAALVAQSQVAQAVVVTREDVAGDVRIVAYVVRGDGTTSMLDGWREGLKQRLPDYMLPQHVVVLPMLPLLPNGKIDRKALPAPSIAGAMPSPSRADEVAPRDALEQAVATAMTQALGRPVTDINAGFFDIGGHSLLAARLSASLASEFKIDVPLRLIFDEPTAAGLARDIRKRMGAANLRHPDARVIKRRSDRQFAPLSLMQQRVWYLEQLTPGTVVYNTPSAHRLTGELDEAALNGAFREMVRRQASLRTVMTVQGDVVMQQILDDVPVELFPAEDLSTLCADDRVATLQRRMEALTAEMFDLTSGPLFRARMFRLSENEHVLFFMTHHIIWDGWSFDLFYQELGASYAALSSGGTVSRPTLAIEYGDFAVWHLQWLQGEELAAQLTHWKEKLSGTLDPLELPTDHPRPAIASDAGDVVGVTVEKGLVERLGAVARQADATLFMTLLAAYFTLLHRMSGQRDIVVGIPVRNRDTADIEAVMGFFVNQLPVRMAIDPAMSFVDFVRQVRGEVMDALAYPDVPFEHLVRELKVPRDYSRSPIYQATFSFQDVRLRNKDWGGLVHENVPVYQHGLSDDLSFGLLMHDKGISGGLFFNTDLFERENAQRISNRFTSLLASIEANPHQTVDALPISPALPQRPAKKVSRQEQSAGVPAAVNQRSDAPEASNDPRVAYLAGVWSELIGTPASAADNFFDLGGHSMLAVQMANRVARDTGIRIKLMRLASQTLAQIALDLPLPQEGVKTLSFRARLVGACKRLLGRAGN